MRRPRLRNGTPIAAYSSSDQATPVAPRALPDTLLDQASYATRTAPRCRCASSSRAAAGHGRHPAAPGHPWWVSG
jgi:hypothetical protein